MKKYLGIITAQPNFNNIQAASAKFGQPENKLKLQYFSLDSDGDIGGYLVFLLT